MPCLGLLHQLPQHGKIPAALGAVVKGRGDGHQTPDVHVAQSGSTLQHGPQIVGGSAGFGGFLADVQLQQNVLPQALLAGLLIDGLQQAQTVHALNNVGLAHHFFHLVGLQVADEMHRLVQISAGIVVDHQLLHMVFAEQIHRQGGTVSNGIGSTGLADGAQQNIAGVTTGGFCSLFHAIADFCHRLRHPAGIKGLCHRYTS